ncbi:hypothetical protein ALO42_102782 [Pseudomonas syringae pv. atrofaciens]|nr:hypothetical protein ALO42_102782 [Pseudomonas syringae pv. atrofaciens]RMP50337.1 hypothetical protein ALQ20_103218 [Pseudomonas syringae pv. atrofaciens]
MVAHHSERKIATMLPASSLLLAARGVINEHAKNAFIRDFIFETVRYIQTATVS